MVHGLEALDMPKFRADAANSLNLGCSQQKKLTFSPSDRL